VGLGSPPPAFYTNDSESINALLKESNNYKKHQWDIFNENVQQQCEMEKAVIGYGEYQLRPEYSFLAVPEEKWFRMSQDQRQRCIQKLNSCTVRSSDSNSPGITTSDTTSDTIASTQLVEDITVGRFSLQAGVESQLSVLLEDGILDTTLLLK
jgi:hypothetical protein